MKKHLSMLILGALLQGCGGSSDSAKEQPDEVSAAVQTDAEVYLDQILSIMQDNAVNRYEVDWGLLTSEAQGLLGDAQSIEDAYPAVERALELLGTNHSFLVSNDNKLITFPSNLNCTSDFEMDQPQAEGIGYIRVDAFSGTPLEGAGYARAIQTEIAEQETAATKGWIVDLRMNNGGSMWPMIAGVGPLLGDVTAGYFIDPDENAEPWGYKGTYSFLNDQVMTNASQSIGNKPQLEGADSKIAVLTSKRTASSGEATMIAFKKMPNVKFFGEPSCGVPTANKNFTLFDGSSLFLTVKFQADREMEKYSGPVAVDVESNPNDALGHAVQWLGETL